MFGTIYIQKDLCQITKLGIFIKNDRIIAVVTNEKTKLTYKVVNHAPYKRIGRSKTNDKPKTIRTFNFQTGKLSNPRAYS